MLFHIRAIARHTEKPREALQARLLYWHYKEMETVATQTPPADISKAFPPRLYILSQSWIFYTENSMFTLIRVNSNGGLKGLLS